MASIQGQITTFHLPDKKNNLDVLGIISKYLFHWPLYLLCFLILAPLAFYFAQKTPPSYEVKASLLIKDDKKNAQKQTTALQEIDLVNSAKVIENEIEILKSRNLISKVVSDLNLWINYNVKEGYKTIDLYHESPVKLTFTNPPKNIEDEVMQVIIVNNKSFDLVLPDKSLQHFQFDKSYTNDLGTWTLHATKELKKFIGDKISISVSDPVVTATLYQKAIDATLSNKLSSTVVLTIEDQNPIRGKDILNNLLLNYNLGNTTDKNKDLKNTIDFLDQKIAELSGDLGSSERGIENFKSSKGLTDIALQSKVSLENLQSNDNKLNEANIQLAAIDRIYNYVNSSQNSEKVPSSNGIDDLGLSNLIEKLSKLQLEYEELAATTPETSPEFEPITRQIRVTKSSIKESVKNIRSSLQSTRNKLSAYNSNFESSIRDIPTQEREYISIKREQASKEGLYTYYLQKREEASANYTAILSDDKIIDQAYAGLPKSSSKLFYAVAMMLTLALPTGLVFGRTLLSNKILSSNDITDETDVPIIAELPFADKKEKIAVNINFSTPTSEQFRALRTALHYLHQKRESGRVTLVTSSIPNEGKSFISTNISTALALTDRKTILLELDMRMPKILEAFGLTNDKVGLSDYFLGNAKVQDIIQPSPNHPNLSIISSGSPILNPSELLEKKALSTLISYLKDNYDDIIIDSPPTHLVADAMIISPLTDVCIYVVRQGVTSKLELKHLNKLIKQNQLNNASIVFNGLEKQRYGYGYSYSKSYYNAPKTNFLKPIFGDFKNRF